MDVESIREDFPLLKNRKDITYLDNAATTLKPKSVIASIEKYYSEVSANVHRGLHKLSEEATIEYENTHKKTAKFLNSKKEEVVLTKGTTESLNLVAYSLMNSGMIKKGDKIIITKMEHHSNIVPWQFLEKKVGAKIEYVDLDENFELNMGDFEEKVRGAKLVSVTAASNTVATKTDLRIIERQTHSEGALLCIDGAQLIPHSKFSFKETNADFVGFSGHKMLGPTGIGGLIAKRELLEKIEPFNFGGDMIQSVDLHDAVWNELPYKFEAGTPNIAGAYGLSAAIDYLEKIGLEKIAKYEEKLTKLALEQFEEVEKVDVYCPKDEKKQGAVILFGSKKLSAHDIALALGEEGICIRSGMHCAEPIVSSINNEGLARASMYFYNTEEEIFSLKEKIKEIMEIFG